MIDAALLGLAGGLLAGLLGVGGGVVFVPGMVLLLDLAQQQAEATSLLAIIPAALVGTVRQRRYANVREHDALRLGVSSLAGVAGGVVLANALSGRTLRVAFAVLLLLIAVRVARRALART